ncbi:hypothetical protein RND81_03G031700 [Saponaria officinalis]|uniref:Retrotransposon gag domain-containing protein n=1 Tax=Saponaria officinalis TaxID=3572 RepID=A0AAW1M511_SAPOF
MVRPSGESSRRETAEAARVRRLEDAFIAFANNANQAGGQPQQQQPQQQTIFDRFGRHRPPTYDGLCDPVVLEEWIREMEKLFTETLCPEDQKVGVASYYLQKEADNWWSISRAAIQAEPGFGWARFIQAYANKFVELSRFATTIVPDEASRVRRIEKNLTPKVRTVLAGSPSVTFQQAYDQALSVYESVKAEEVETEKRNPDISGVLREKRPFTSQSSYQETNRPKFVPRQSPSGGHPAGPPTTLCARCRKPYHPGDAGDLTGDDTIFVESED